MRSLDLDPEESKLEFDQKGFYTLLYILYEFLGDYIIAFKKLPNGKVDIDIKSKRMPDFKEEPGLKVDRLLDVPVKELDPDDHD